MNNVLLIGNGFDIGQGYPTSYLKFAEIVDTFNNLVHNEVIMQSSGLDNTAKDKYEFLDWFIFSYCDYRDEFYSLINENVWVSLFYNKYNNLKVGDYWYDLENIIKEEINNRQSIIMQDIEKAQNDLKRFRRAFEIYLIFFIQFAKDRNKRLGINNVVKRNLNIIQPEYVINYNYIDTISSLIKKKIDIDFIHGKAKLLGTIEDCNIVFGVNEICLEERKNSCGYFLKSAQIKKYGIESKYNDWLKDRKCALHIYGHSLDLTDRESLADILLNSSIKEIHIWSLNEKDYYIKVNNISKIALERFDTIKDKIRMELI